MMDTKIKQDQICIGKNIREIRISKGMGQTELVRKIQLRGITMTRETLVKIERGVQHIYQSWRKAPAFRHGDISQTLLPRKEILRALH